MFALPIVSACQPRAREGSPSDDATASSASVESSTPRASPTVTATARATAIATATATPVPIATATPSPNATPGYGRALKEPFRTDLTLFPDATRYDLDLVLDLEEMVVSGHEQIDYTNSEDAALDALYLRLFPDTAGYGGAMTVTNVTLDGQLVQPTRELEGSALRLPLEPPLPPREQINLILDFTLVLPTDNGLSGGQQPGGGYRQLGYYNNVVALANAYPIIPVYDDEGWNVELAPTYGDAVFSDVAFFDVSITAPAPMTLAASGTCVPSSSDTGKASWTCVAAPMRDFNAILGENYQVEDREVEGVTVKSVFYTDHEGGGAAALDYASQALRLFNARIGPYPFTELDVVETPTLAGGIEYPGLIVINEAYYGAQGASDRMEWVVVHEVLHQWWYGLVGNDQVDEPWIDEALVQYCTLLYFGEQYGKSVANRLVETVFQQPYQTLQESGQDKPVGLPVAAYSQSSYGPLVYQKGPLYFHKLRQQIGEDAFWEVLQTYFERNRYDIATPEGWLSALQAVTGSEHRDVYEKWVTGQ